jgi:hypothetical protein
MSMKRTPFIVGVVAAFLLGLCGGAFSGRLAAQPAAAVEVKAGSFVLVDAEGSKRAVLGFDKSGQPNLSIFDERGRVVWSTRASALLTGQQ